MNWKFIVGLVLIIFGYIGSFGRMSGDIESSNRIISSGSFWFMFIIAVMGGVLLVLSFSKKK